MFSHFILEKAYMLRLGFEPGAAGWWSHMDPKSYGSYDTFCCPLQKEDLDTILQEMNVKNIHQQIWGNY